jgi:hypothetical protein
VPSVVKKEIRINHREHRDHREKIKEFISISVTSVPSVVNLRKVELTTGKINWKKDIYHGKNNKHTY